MIASIFGAFLRWTPPMENDPSEGIKEVTPSEGIMHPTEGITADWQDFVVTPYSGNYDWPTVEIILLTPPRELC